MYQKTYINFVNISLIKGDELMERSEFLTNIFGYERIKNELYKVYTWFSNASNDKSLKTLLPKGVLFYGEPGLGKTYLMREFALTLTADIFIINGEKNNLEKEIIEVYKKANESKLAIVIIDELDTLIDKDQKLIRVIQTALDGYKNNSVLTLATANYIHRLPEALLREGRFDKKYLIDKNYNDTLLFIKNTFNRLNLKFKENEIEVVSNHLSLFSFATIKSIINQAYLEHRNNLNVNDIIRVADLNISGLIPDDDNVINYNVAVHEIGHSLYTRKYTKKHKFLRAALSINGGTTSTNMVEDYETVQSRIESIEISLAGAIAEKVVLGYHDIGSGNDFDSMYNTAFRLANRTCINGKIEFFCEKTKFFHNQFVSEWMLYKAEKRTSKLIKKLSKKVFKCLKSEKDNLIKGANYLMTHKTIVGDELDNVLSAC